MPAPVRRWVPAVTVVLILFYNAIVTWREASSPNPLSVLYSALTPFVGSYNPLEGQPSQASTPMLIGLLAAIITTFSAVIKVALDASRRRLGRLRAMGTRDALIVIGSSPEADSIAGSINEHSPGKLVRFSEIDVDTGNHLALTAVTEATTGSPVHRLLTSAEAIFVAASTDTRTLQLVKPLGLATSTHQFHLVRGARLAAAIYPRTLDELPTSEAFYPADKLGQVIAEIAAAHPEPSTTISVLACGDHGASLAHTVRNWLRHSSDASAIISETATHLLVDDEQAANLVVLVGDPEDVTAAVAQRIGLQALIAVVDADVLNLVSRPTGVVTSTHRESPTEPPTLARVVIVEPSDVWDHRLIQRGVPVQWGRAFNEAYNQLYGSRHPGSQPSIWRPDARGRAEQASIGAAGFMLANLRDHGYVLRQGSTGWVSGEPPTETLLEMARAEHEEWRHRRLWVDENGIERPVAHRLIDGEWKPGANCVPFEDLDHETREFNLTVIRRVYPALAAMFGYGITRLTAADDDQTAA